MQRTVTTALLLLMAALPDLVGEDHSLATALRELQADYVGAGEPPPEVLTAALHDPPPGDLVVSTPASERFFQIRACVAGMRGVPKAIELLDAPQRDAVRTWCRIEAEQLLTDLIAHWPGPRTVPADLVRRRPQLWAVQALLRLHRERGQWQQETIASDQPWPVRAEALDVQRAMAAACVELILQPPTDAKQRIEPLDQALWMITAAGSAQPPSAAFDAELLAALEPYLITPVRRELDHVRALLADPQQGAFDRDEQGRHRTAGEAAVALAQTLLRTEALAATLAPDPPPIWAQEVEAAQQSLHGRRAMVLLALTQGDPAVIMHVHAECEAAATVAECIATILADERSLTAAIVRAGVQPEHHDRLTALMTEWRTQEAAALTAIRQAAALRQAARLAATQRPNPQPWMEATQTAHARLQMALKRLSHPPAAAPEQADF